MARPLRIERAGGWYHVTGRGNERRDIFRDDLDRQHFCELLAELVTRFRVRLHAYVLLGNHYHLLLELTEPNLSRAGQWLNVSYSVWFNRRHDRSGHLFQGRFKSVIVDPAAWGLNLSRYVHLNPVRVKRLRLGKAQRQQQRAGTAPAPDAELVRERIRRLRQYRWSSYRAYAGLGKPPAWLETQAILELGGGKKAERARRYRAYVEAAVREGLMESPWEELKEQVVLGGEAFLKKVRAQRGVRRLAKGRPTWKEVVARVEQVKGLRWAEFCDRHGDSGRDLALAVARRVSGLTLEELARAAGLSDYKTVSTAIRRFERRLPAHKAEAEQFKRVCQLLETKV